MNESERGRTSDKKRRRKRKKGEEEETGRVDDVWRCAVRVFFLLVTWSIGQSIITLHSTIASTLAPTESRIHKRTSEWERGTEN